MARKIEVDNVWSIHEISTFFSVSVQAVINWQSRGIGFPDPAITVGIGELWDSKDVVAWGQQTKRCDAEGRPTRRKAGRPKKATT